MITTVRLVNLHHHTLLNFFLFLLVLKTFKIYPLSNFQIFDTVLLTLVTKLYVPFPWLIYFITGSLYLFDPLHPTSDNYQSVLCICELAIFFFLVLFFVFKFHIWVRSYGFCLSLTYFTQRGTFQVHACCRKWQDFIFFNHRIVFHCVYMPHFHPSVDT